MVRVVDLDSEFGMITHEVANIFSLGLWGAGAYVLVACCASALGEHFVLLSQPELAPVISVASGAAQTVWSCNCIRRVHMDRCR
jgi:hypothetical protein